MSYPSTGSSVGRVHHADGVQFYSPNSLVDAQLNLETVPQSLESNPFKPGRTGSTRVRYQDFVYPRRWSRAFAWVSFIPMIPSQWCDRRDSYFGRILSQLPPIQRRVDPHTGASSYSVASKNAWVHLESSIYQAVVILSKHYGAPCVLPFLPNAIGCCDVYPHKHQLKRKLEQTREWLFVWLGALSYLVASVRNPWKEGLKSQLDHQWSSLLRSRGISASFIDALLHSLVVDYRVEVRRAGIVLDIHTPSPEQPHPRWFIEHGVPVWYRWSSVEEELSQRLAFYLALRPPSPLALSHSPTTPTTGAPPEDPLLQGSQPSSSPAQRNLIQHGDPSPAGSRPPHPLELPPPTPTHSPLPRGEPDPIQMPAGSPEPSDDPPLRIASPPLPCGREAGTRVQPAEWLDFFRSREEIHGRLIQCESSKNRQRRLSRMQEPPTVSAKVFEWYPSQAPGVQYERLPVLAQGRADTLLLYSDSQKRYDPILNEWDCCAEWGPDDSEEAWSGSEEGVATPNPDVSAAATSLASVDNPEPPPGISTSYVETDLPTDAFLEAGDTGSRESLVDDVDEAFRNFCGFIPPLPTDPPRGAPSPPEAKERNFFLRAVGLDPSAAPCSDYQYFSGTHYLAAHEFLRSLSSRQPPPCQGSWDLSDESLLPVRLSHRFERICIVLLDVQAKADVLKQTVRYYIFDMADDGFSPWKLGVTSAAAALLVCRRPAHHTVADLAFFLVQHGVPFRTFHPSHAALRLPPRDLPMQLCIPVRPLNHTFTKEDYDAYVHMRTLLLGQSHMQAALKRGGIVWRLAIGILGVSRSTLPPSLWGASHWVDVSGERLLDDVLTTTELDLICGAYECVSGALSPPPMPGVTNQRADTLGTQDDGKLEAAKLEVLVASRPVLRKG